MSFKPTPNSYPTALQGHLLACLLNDPSAFQTCRPILNSSYFDDPLVRAVSFGLQYFDDTGKPAPISLIQATTNAELTKLPEEAICETAWLVNTIEEFCRYRAMENAILDGLDFINNGKTTEYVNRVNEALSISLNQRQKFQDMSLRELLAVTTPEWLIPGLIYERETVMIYGPPDSFKSFIVLHVASLLAHGMLWNGHDLKPRAVLYVAAEGGTMMARRRKAWFLNHKLPLDDDNLTVIDEPIMLTDPADVRSFINAMKRRNWQGGLITIDTVSKCIPGECESDVQVMSQVVSAADLIAKELNCAVLLVHHTGWDGAHARGSSASLGNCNAMIRIDRKSDHHATVTVEKQKDAPRKTFEFILNLVKLGILDRDGNEITSLCAVEASEDEKAEDDAMTSLADRISIASAMTRDEMKQHEVVNLMEKILGLREQQARKRIIAAVPEEWTRTRGGNEVVELRRVVVTQKNVTIERRPITA